MSHESTTSGAPDPAEQIILGVDPGLADAEIIRAEIVTGPSGVQYLQVIPEYGS